jgi:hypothetical protein
MLQSKKLATLFLFGSDVHIHVVLVLPYEVFLSVQLGMFYKLLPLLETITTMVMELRMNLGDHMGR